MSRVTRGLHSTISGRASSARSAHRTRSAMSPTVAADAGARCVLRAATFAFSALDVLFTQNNSRRCCARILRSAAGRRAPSISKAISSAARGAPSARDVGGPASTATTGLERARVITSTQRACLWTRALRRAAFRAHLRRNLAAVSTAARAASTSSSMSARQYSRRSSMRARRTRESQHAALNPCPWHAVTSPDARPPS